MIGIVMDDQPPAEQQRRRRHRHRHRDDGQHVVVALLVLLLAPLAASDIQDKVCSATSYYTAGSSYEANLELLAVTLSRDAASSRRSFLYATGTTGAVPDAVHGLAQCRGDVDRSTCYACLTGAFEDARQLCIYDKDATVYYDHCLLRFSNENFLLDLETTDGYGQAFLNTSTSTTEDGGGMVFFSAADVSLLMNTVADYAANSSTRFGTGVLRLPGAELFGLAQCTPDLALTSCRSCLANLLLLGNLGSQKFSGTKIVRARVLLCSCMYGGSSFFSGSPMLQLHKHDGKSKQKKTAKILKITLPLAAAGLAGAAILLLLLRRRRRRNRLPDIFDPEDKKCINSLAIPISTLRDATGDFSTANVIGQGGFGKVYKGILEGNQEIAVKRLSQSSRQGLQELKNEIATIAGLRHKNVVRVIGVCLDGLERLIFYKYLPNGSLDKLVFNPQRRSQLGPEKVMTIIAGVARGLHYVHEDSLARIIHRDLKASNVLLDQQLEPKISDFGLSRILGGSESHEVTSRVAGTYGYMAPEYLTGGNYSVKSDVFSFGILVLEILTGNRNGGHHLLNLVWENWEKGTMMDIIVGSSALSSSSGEMLRRCFQVGLLCVQDSPADRPTMSAVTVMLSSNSALPQPSRASPPAPVGPAPGASTGSQNNISITELQPR